jgi:hypothetical protein
MIGSALRWTRHYGLAKAERWCTIVKRRQMCLCLCEYFIGSHNDALRRSYYWGVHALPPLPVFDIPAPFPLKLPEYEGSGRIDTDFLPFWVLLWFWFWFWFEFEFEFEFGIMLCRVNAVEKRSDFFPFGVRSVFVYPDASRFITTGCNMSASAMRLDDWNGKRGRERVNWSELKKERPKIQTLGNWPWLRC